MRKRRAGTEETGWWGIIGGMEEIVRFVLELDKLKGVLRKVRPLGLERYENSAEHTWQLMLMALALERYAAVPVDANRVLRMLLVHDVGEIDTGDTMAFVEGGWAERKRDELAAVTRILDLLPEGSRAGLGAELLTLWKEFETGETPEAKFANSVDRAMPVLLNLNNSGQSWKENGISYERVVKRVEVQIAEGCPAMWEYLRGRLDEVRGLGMFGG